MYKLKKNGMLFTSKFVGTGPSSYEKRIYRTALSQRLRNTGLEEKQVMKHRVRTGECLFIAVQLKRLPNAHKIK